MRSRSIIALGVDDREVIVLLESRGVGVRFIDDDDRGWTSGLDVIGMDDSVVAAAYLKCDDDDDDDDDDIRFGLSLEIL